MTPCEIQKDHSWYNQWSCGHHGVWFRHGGIPTLCPAGEAVIAEQCRWQDRIEMTIQNCNIIVPDASGNESGDPLDYSSDQIRMVLEHLKEYLDDADVTQTRVRKALDKAGVPHVEPYPPSVVLDSEYDRALKAGGYVVPPAQRVDRLAASRDEAIAVAMALDRAFRAGEEPDPEALATVDRWRTTDAG